MKRFSLLLLLLLLTVFESKLLAIGDTSHEGVTRERNESVGESTQQGEQREAWDIVQQGENVHLRSTPRERVNSTSSQSTTSLNSSPEDSSKDESSFSTTAAPTSAAEAAHRDEEKEEPSQPKSVLQDTAPLLQEQNATPDFSLLEEIQREALSLVDSLNKGLEELSSSQEKGEEISPQKRSSLEELLKNSKVWEESLEEYQISLASPNQSLSLDKETWEKIQRLMSCGQTIVTLSRRLEEALYGSSREGRGAFPVFLEHHVVLSPEQKDEHLKRAHSFDEETLELLRESYSPSLNQATTPPSKNEIIEKVHQALQAASYTLPLHGDEENNSLANLLKGIFSNEPSVKEFVVDTLHMIEKERDRQVNELRQKIHSRIGVDKTAPSLSPSPAGSTAASLTSRELCSTEKKMTPSQGEIEKDLALLQAAQSRATYIELLHNTARDLIHIPALEFFQKIHLFESSSSLDPTPILIQGKLTLDVRHKENWNKCALVVATELRAAHTLALIAYEVAKQESNAELSSTTRSLLSEINIYLRSSPFLLKRAGMGSDFLTKDKEIVTELVSKSETKTPPASEPPFKVPPPWRRGI